LLTVASVQPENADAAVGGSTPSSKTIAGK
jgi:hypothetical protein